MKRQIFVVRSDNLRKNENKGKSRNLEFKWKFLGKSKNVE